MSLHNAPHNALHEPSTALTQLQRELKKGQLPKSICRHGGQRQQSHKQAKQFHVFRQING